MYTYLDSPWSHLLYPQLMQNGASCCSVPSTYRRFSNILLHWTFPLVNTHDPSFNPSVSPRPSSSLCSPPRFLLLVTHCYRVPVHRLISMSSTLLLRFAPTLCSSPRTLLQPAHPASRTHSVPCILHSAFRITLTCPSPSSVIVAHRPSSLCPLSVADVYVEPRFAY